MNTRNIRLEFGFVRLGIETSAYLQESKTIANQLILMILAEILSKHAIFGLCIPFPSS